jgi:hypothetical protein
MELNQASKQYHLSMVEIHQAYRIDVHRAIGIIELHEVYIQISKIGRPILAIDPGKDTWHKIRISLTRTMEQSKGRFMRIREM